MRRRGGFPPKIAKLVVVEEGLLKDVDFDDISLAKKGTGGRR